MKKVVYLLLSFMCLGSFAALAQDDADGIKAVFEESKDRAAKIKKLIEKQPRATGLQSIDGFTDQVYAAAASCSECAKTFENLYTRQVSEPDADGVTEVNITKPKLDDWMNLLAELTNQAAQITTMAPAAAGMTGALTEIKNPMQIGKAKKAIKSTGDLFKLIGEENAAEVKAVKGIISMLKSNKNL